jgi:hypothetical protein
MCAVIMRPVDACIANHGRETFLKTITRSTTIAQPQQIQSSCTHTHNIGITFF